MYLVTGATGNVGSEVVAQLLAKGEPVRVFVRDAAKAARWRDRVDVDVAIGDFGSPETFAQAAAGVKGVFLMNGGPGGESFRQLIAGVKEARIVFLSTMFAGVPGVTIGQLHKDKEDAIRETGLPAAVVRPDVFMTNTFQWSASIKTQGIVYNSMGTGQAVPIAAEDIAAVVVHALTSPVAQMQGQVFELTGPESLSVPQQVAILARVLGKALRSVDIPVQTAIDSMVRAGVAPHIAAAVGQSHEAVRDGRIGIVKDTVTRVTGRAPKTFESWAHEHAGRFA